MLETSAPEGINPWMVALLMTVALVRPKSSAVSVSRLLSAGAESDASLPSGFPVLKKNTSAIAGAAATRPTESAATDAIVMYAVIKTSRVGCDNVPFLPNPRANVATDTPRPPDGAFSWFRLPELSGLKANATIGRL